ncbi:hypothetical protein [Spartinivicinus ruber]|uniref:hypothetical protein n=1 Tax=Spartinivicinus ruber TaxID=2683272 RepID=UPI0013D51B7A|nr:hypothetical protein [Spartinivicinus ruber]
MPTLENASSQFNQSQQAALDMMALQDANAAAQIRRAAQMQIAKSKADQARQFAQAAMAVLGQTGNMRIN